MHLLESHIVKPLKRQVEQTTAEQTDVSRALQGYVTTTERHIGVAVMAEKGAAHMAVADDGIGMAPGREATDRKGLGLGLYISKAVVEAHGGGSR